MRRSFHMDLKKNDQKFCIVLIRNQLPNMFQCSAFKKHIQFLMNQNQQNLDFSTLDRKEEIQQYSNNVNLHPIYVSYKQLKALHDKEDFGPADLDNSSSLNKIRKVFYSFMKEVAAALNHNLVRNSNAFISNGGEINLEFKF